MMGSEKWKVERTAAFDVWWSSLTQKQQDDIAYVVGILSEHGPQLNFPHSSGIKGSCHGAMRELRVQSRGKPLRIFYIFDPRRAAVLLIGGDKTGKNRFYETYVPMADKIYEEHLKHMKGKER